MRILVFGDSIGYGMWDISEGGWAERLRRAYYKEYADNGYSGDTKSVYNLSIAGDTSNELLARLDSEAKARIWHGADVVIVIAIGTNDSRLNGEIALMERDRYGSNLEAIFSKAKSLTDKVVALGLPTCDEDLTTPMAWADISYTNTRLEQFEQTASSIATAQGVSFVPLFNNFKLRAANGEKLLQDGLHPNTAGHGLIYDQVKPVIDGLA